MELLGGDAHLAAESELAAVGEAGGGVDIDGGGIDAAGEFFRRRRIGGDDRLAVAGGMAVDMGDGFVNVGDDLDGEDIIEELGIKVVLAGGGSVDDLLRLGIKAQFDGVFGAVIDEAFL